MMEMAGRASVERIRQRLFTSDQCHIVKACCIVFGFPVFAGSAWGRVRSGHVGLRSVVVGGALRRRCQQVLRQSIVESSVAQSSTPIRTSSNRGGLATAFSLWLAHFCRWRCVRPFCRRALVYGSRGLRHLVARACHGHASVEQLH